MNAAIAALLFSSLTSHVSAAPGLVEASAKSHQFKIEGKLASSHHTSASTVEKHALGFIDCTANQERLIKEAATGSNAMIANANSYLANPTSDKHKHRYTTWFGEFSNLRYKNVVSNFKNMENKATSLTYDCKACLTRVDKPYDKLSAYVNNGEYLMKINVCGAFWRAPTIGAYSKAGIIVHELSHFHEHGGTMDHAYGTKEARALAVEVPWFAVMNADNYKYFAENKPTLS
ncbi:hypothetical protein RSAG8_11586, partial [Rhizoctonia solani AG-8 WAC10335]